MKEVRNRNQDSGILSIQALGSQRLSGANSLEHEYRG